MFSRPMRYLFLTDVIHRSRAQGQSDVLHLTGLQQIVSVTAFLLQFGLNGGHLLLQLRQLPNRADTNHDER